MPAVIFDLDGTLSDSWDAHFDAFVAVSADLGHALTTEEFAGFFGRANEPIIEQLHDWAGLPAPDAAQIDAVADAKETRFRAAIAGDAYPYMAGAVELLSTLTAARWPIAIGTSTPRENLVVSVDAFSRAGITFDATVCRSDVVNGKPDPETFLRAAVLMGVPPHDCVVVEDAPSGITAAHGGGMACVGLASRGRTRAALAEADLVVDSLAALNTDVFAKLLADHGRVDT